MVCGLIISDRIRNKLLLKHNINEPESEICEAFQNREGLYLIDTREKHRTDPPTKWFISETDKGRLLKVVFVQKINKETQKTEIHIKTAYEPNEDEIRIYRMCGLKN